MGLDLKKKVLKHTFYYQSIKILRSSINLRKIMKLFEYENHSKENSLSRQSAGSVENGILLYRQEIKLVPEKFYPAVAPRGCLTGLGGNSFQKPCPKISRFFCWLPTVLTKPIFLLR